MVPADRALRVKPQPGYRKGNRSTSRPRQPRAGQRVIIDQDRQKTFFFPGFCFWFSGLVSFFPPSFFTRSTNSIFFSAFSYKTNPSTTSTIYAASVHSAFAPSFDGLSRLSSRVFRRYRRTAVPHHTAPTSQVPAQVYIGPGYLETLNCAPLRHSHAILHCHFVHHYTFVHCRPPSPPRPPPTLLARQFHSRSLQ